MKPTYTHWRVTFKQRHAKHPFKSELRGPYDREDVIRHYGLSLPDIEWYTIEEITN